MPHTICPLGYSFFSSNCSTLSKKRSTSGSRPSYRRKKRCMGTCSFSNAYSKAAKILIHSSISKALHRCTFIHWYKSPAQPHKIIKIPISFPITPSPFHHTQSLFCFYFLPYWVFFFLTLQTAFFLLHPIYGMPPLLRKFPPRFRHASFQAQ